MKMYLQVSNKMRERVGISGSVQTLTIASDTFPAIFLHSVLVSYLLVWWNTYCRSNQGLQAGPSLQHNKNIMKNQFAKYN